MAGRAQVDRNRRSGLRVGSASLTGCGWALRWGGWVGDERVECGTWGIMVVMWLSCTVSHMSCSCLTCLAPVSRLFRACFAPVSRLFRACFAPVSRLFRACLAVSRRCHMDRCTCFAAVSRCFTAVSRVSHRLSHVSRGCFAVFHMCFAHFTQILAFSCACFTDVSHCLARFHR